MKSLDMNTLKQKMTEIIGSPVRDGMHIDFGRRWKPGVLSAFIPGPGTPPAGAVARLYSLRKALPSDMTAFLGTDSWLGEIRREGIEVVAAIISDPFDVLRLAETEAVNYGLDTEGLIAILSDIHCRVGIDIYWAAADTIALTLKSQPMDMAAFAQEIIDFCPDVVDQGCRTLEALADFIRRRSELFLWWD
jgi:hypothetical protein